MKNYINHKMFSKFPLILISLIVLQTQLASSLFAQNYSQSQSCTLDQATGTIINPTPLITGTYGSRWNFATNTIAFVKADSSGYYRIFTMKPDGSHVTNLSALQPSLPPGHHGSVYWHPSGKYLLFTAQKREWKGLRMFGNPAFGALPGFGRHDDLWLISSDGSHSWQLTNERDSNFQGVLMPVFSPDGKHIAWASSLPAEKRKMNYALKIADFVEYPQPHLENIKSYQPGGPTYYETGSFTADGKSLYYTSDQDTHNFWLSQIYRLDLETGISTRLTRGITYNEHPTAISTPTGDWVIFMSSKGAQRYPGQLFLGTDWYACRRDGTGLKRLTWMNLNRKDNPENTGKPLVGCTVSISPDGTYFLGDVQDDLVKQTGKVLVVRLVHYLSD